MKNILVIVLNFWFANYSFSQAEFIPLRIDSQYHWSKFYGIEGEIFEDEELTGYSYDSDDRLIQLRHPFIRENYNYDSDTVYWVKEDINFPNGWKPVYKSKRVYENEKIKSELFEKEYAGTWENHELKTYFHNSSGLETLYYLQRWGNGEWEDFNKSVCSYDMNGNLIQKLEYSTYGIGDYIFFQGKEYEYDNMNRKTQETNLIKSLNGIFSDEKRNWIYGDDDFIDTFKIYKSQTPGIWNNSIKTIYNYSSQLDTTILKSYSWSNNSWKHSGKRLSFRGPNIYSSSPDSINYYSYNVDLMTYTLYKRSYYNYTEIGDNKVYFKFTSYTNSQNSGDWELTELTERWYSLEDEININHSTIAIPVTVLYPNPCEKGQILNFSTLGVDNSKLEALIFDLQGHLVSKFTISNNSHQIIAPFSKGIYSVLLVNGQNALGISKLVVE